MAIIPHNTKTKKKRKTRSTSTIKSKINKTWRQRIKETDPFLYKARSIRSSLLSKKKHEGLRATTPTKDEILEWLLSQQPLKCYYSGMDLDILDITIDHKIPINRGGDHNLDNLCICSMHMNVAKGTMTDTEFNELLDIISKWEDGGATILRRLKIGRY